MLSENSSVVILVRNWKDGWQFKLSPETRFSSGNLPPTQTVTLGTGYLDLTLACLRPQDWRAVATLLLGEASGVEVEFRMDSESLLFVRL